MTKDDLMNMVELHRKIKKMETDIEVLYTKATKVNCPLTDIKVQSSKLNLNAMYLDEASDIAHDVSKAKDELTQLICELSQYFKLFDRDERLVATYRYIGGESWENVANDMNYSVRQVFRLNGEIIKKMAVECSRMQ